MAATARWWAVSGHRVAQRPIGEVAPGDENGGALGENPPRLLPTPSFHRALHRAQVPVVEPIRLDQLESPQNFQCGDCRLAIEPGADLVLHPVEHRGPFWYRFAAPVRAAMCRPPFAVAPRRLETGGKAVEIDNDRLRQHGLCAATIDTLAEFCLRRADFGEERRGVGPHVELPQPGLVIVCDLRMRQHAIYRRHRPVLALDDPGAGTLLLFELE